MVHILHSIGRICTDGSYSERKQIVYFFLNIWYGCAAKEVEDMKDLLILIGVVVFWVVLQRYILPRLGVPT